MYSSTIFFNGVTRTTRAKAETKKQNILPSHIVILDDDDYDDGVGYGRGQKQRHVHADQQYTPGFGELHLRRRELGDKLVDDRRLSYPGVPGPQATATVRRRVVEHFASRSLCVSCPTVVS